MRLYKIIPSDVESVAAHPTRKDVDERANLRLSGLGGGRAIIVVVAGDDPDFVITTFPDD